MNVKKLSEKYGVDDLPLWRDEDAHKILQDMLKKNNVSEEIFAALISACREHAHKGKPWGITSDFDEIFQSLGD